MSDAGHLGQATTVEELMQLGLPRAQAEHVAGGALSAWGQPDALGAWRQLCRETLRPDHPFAIHQLLHRRTFARWDATSSGPAPTWVPSDEQRAATNAGRAYDGDFNACWRHSVQAPEVFWPQMLQRLGVVVEREAEQVLDLSDGPEHARWFSGMRLNIAASALRDGDAPAVVWQAEGGDLVEVSRAQLRQDALAVAAGLAALGLGPGDAVAVAMPMTYRSVAIYLGIVALGGSVVSIADSFAAPEIATRLRIAEAKAIFTQDVIARGGKALPLYPRVLEAQAPVSIVLAAGDALASALREGDRDWEAFLAAGAGTAREPFAIAEADHMTNVLFSSGTTGEPKAIGWTQLTPIKAATDGWAHHDIRAGDVVCWPTNLGWMMGPWLIYASLLNGATIALFDGSPLGRPFGAFVAHAGVTMLGVVPSLVKAWRGSDCMKGLDWSSLRCFSSTGEASAAADMHWLMARAGYRPVVEYCGGTEIGGGYICGSVLQPQAPATFSSKAVGCDFVILDAGDQPADIGQLCLRPPMLGSSQRLLNRDHHEVYYAGMPAGPNGEVLRRHGDHMERLPGGYHRAHGRVDDTMNLGGIKTSSAEIERVCNRVQGVHETAAIAVSPPDGGPSQLVLYVVLSADEPPTEAPLKEALQAAVRAHLNPLFKVSDVVPIGALPRTASNKVMRRVLRARYAEERSGA